jgi:hypothetical protein
VAGKNNKGEHDPEMHHYRRLVGLFLILGVVLSVLVGCGPEDTPTIAPGPDATATLPSSPLATPQPTATPTAAAVSPIPTPRAYEEQYAVVGVELDDVLNVRTAPGADSAVAGTIPSAGTGVLGAPAEGVEVEGASWVPVQYGEVAGWANAGYLARQVGRAEEGLPARAAEVLFALRDRDFEHLSELAHPEKGVRFSPYTYVRTEPDSPQGEDLVFGAEELADLQNNPTVYRWGHFDGSGEPIDLTVQAYWDRFVFDVDFTHPDVIGFGETIGQGNTINNVAEVYPEAAVVEYHLEGSDPEFGGLDWRSLRLVMEQVGSAWYLVGVVHDEWTI